MNGNFNLDTYQTMHRDWGGKTFQHKLLLTEEQCGLVYELIKNDELKKVPVSEIDLYLFYNHEINNFIFYFVEKTG